MNNEEIFLDCEDLIQKIISKIQTQYHKIKQQGYSDQQSSDLEKGLVNKNGIYVPLSSIEHKILFDGFESIILETFINLYTNLFSKWEEAFAQFAIRTLGEIGFERIPILFSNILEEKERDKYKLMLWLADYASMISRDRKYHRTYKLLLEEFNHLLSTKELEFYYKVLDEHHKNSPLENLKLVKEARKKINSLQSSLNAKLKLLPLFREINIRALNTTFSHILHGNVLLLMDILKPKRTDSQKMRVYWTLILTGINTINAVNTYLNQQYLDSELIEINSDFKLISEKVSKNYQSYS